MGLKSGQHYNFNGQSNVLTFYNKSEIIFKDLAYNPSDQNYDSLGSLEISAAFIDEAAQIMNTQIAEELALPPVKIHCSILAEDAIKAAIKDYKEKYIQ
jgi:ssRNA-specific RNase YbeY (16S rRNA maturation enzyme)